MEKEEANRVGTRYKEEGKQIERLNELIPQITGFHYSWSTYQISRANGGTKIIEYEDKKEKLAQAFSESKRIITDLDKFYNPSPAHHPAYFTNRTPL